MSVGDLSSITPSIAKWLLIDSVLIDDSRFLGAYVLMVKSQIEGLSMFPGPKKIGHHWVAYLHVYLKALIYTWSKDFGSVFIALSVPID